MNKEKIEVVMMIRLTDEQLKTLVNKANSWCD